MKKNLLLCIIALPIILFYSCNNTSQKPAPKSDTTTSQRRQDGDSVSRIAFVDKNDKSFTDSVQAIYRAKGLKIVDKKDYYEYFNYFATLFTIEESGPVIKDFKPFPFSIYEMYNGMQQDLVMKEPTEDLGGTPPVIVDNIFRIYPAIDAAKKEFYLVILKEQEKPAFPPSTVLAGDYYSIRGDVFGKHPDKTAAETDIKTFQSVWGAMKDPKNPTYKFAECRSFSYSVENYDQLLSKSVPFWGLDDCKKDLTLKNRVIMLVPVIDNHDPKDVRLRLVAIAHRKAGNYYSQEYGLDFFDNMYPCPTQCPDNEIK